jgi:hypothetical protein
LLSSNDQFVGMIAAPTAYLIWDSGAEAPIAARTPRKVRMYGCIRSRFVITAGARSTTGKTRWQGRKDLPLREGVHV